MPYFEITQKIDQFERSLQSRIRQMRLGSLDKFCENTQLQYLYLANMPNMGSFILRYTVGDRSLQSRVYRMTQEVEELLMSRS